MNNLPLFYSCPKKHEARFQTIIKQYRDNFGQALPLEKQYWTMCGPHTNELGIFAQGSELDQVVRAKLISEDQFYGVDIQQEIIEKNRLAKPDVKWFHSDFLSKMKEYHHAGKFNPAIVNADLLHMKKIGTREASRILSFLTDCGQKDILFICNVMLTNPYSRKRLTPEEVEDRGNSVIEEFKKCTAFRHAWNSGSWKFFHSYYVYNGTGKRSKTVLSSFIFTKKS